MLKDAEGQGDECSDLELVARCQRGETAAFDQLVTRHRTRVYTMIYNMVRNEEDAWDLAQDGFLRAWKSLERFRGQSSFYTWLYRIVMNVTIDWLRKKKVEGAVEFDDDIGARAVDPAAITFPKQAELPHRKLENEEVKSRIDSAISRLSPEHRAVILLKEVDGLAYHEIANVVGCSIGTVMSRLFYARKKLQGLLKDVYESI